METLGTNEVVVKDIMSHTLADVVDKRWTLDYWNTGGGVMCIIANHPDMPQVHPDFPDKQRVYVGDGSGDIGWSDEYGEKWGELDDPNLQDAEGIGLQFSWILNDWFKA